MPLDIARLRQRIQGFDFRKLFIEELGWDKHNAGVQAALDGQLLDLKPIAQKHGFQVFECPPAANGEIPDFAGRGAIEKQVAKSAHEHIIVYTDAAKTVQKWQWVRRELGRPLARREDTFAKGQTGERLAQKLQHLFVSLKDEVELTLPGVKGTVQKAFDVDRVTKRFYERFKTEHTSFLKFIKGIGAVADSEWYASLMLNRLMFIYFIQKKGFLDGDRDYLRNRLRDIQAERGKDKFHTFYRYFLLRLFHEGLGQPPSQRKKDLEKLLGKVPYLNGGLFDVHDLERAYPEIQIADDAFRRLFDFFDTYQWHLDERPLRADNEINPDVLGYIFEKYINQKQMGAYYTKEDITGYTARNTLITFLLNAAKKSCAIAFEPEGAVWRLLRNDPDRYIYEPVRRGVDLPLPDDIAAGLEDVSKRGNWNKPAGLGYSLPTETWREHVARRQRCHELRAKLRAGDIHDINDLITYNLDICQFAGDVIDNCEGPELLRAFYRAIEGVSVLDPTCGSGAFLFAALNLLEPLYEACLNRMQGFLDDLDRSGDKHHPDKFSDFRKILDDVERHPNRRYFILKSIIVGNLYGVDIMEEAVEICKLRLFLKLVAQVEKTDQIEPLPDIDFNIRAGNTLIGFASLEEIKRRMEGTLGFQQKELDRVMEEAEIVDRAFKRFRQMQTDAGMVASEFNEAKSDLRNRLGKLRAELDRYLAGEYGIESTKADIYAEWLKTHQPFHWLAEFYGIIHDGGFDVIIGNPPYVEYSKIRSIYTVRHYKTDSASNLYAFATERSLALLRAGGSFGFIIPISSVCTQRMQSLQDRLTSGKSAWFSNYAERPSKLFTGAEVLLTIALVRSDGSPAQIFSTGFIKWSAAERDTLFHGLRYNGVNAKPKTYVIPKIGCEIDRSVLTKLTAGGTMLGDSLRSHSASKVFYRIGGGRYWKIFTNFQPRFVLNGEQSVSSRENYLYLPSQQLRDAAISILSSSLFYWYFILTTNCRDLNPSDLKEFPVDPAALDPTAVAALAALCQKLMVDYKKNSCMKEKTSKQTGEVVYQEFYPRQSRAILDDIDIALARALRLSEDESEYVRTFDIKYRMGQGDEEDE